MHTFVNVSFPCVYEHDQVRNIKSSSVPHVYFTGMESSQLSSTYFMYVENSRAGIMKRSGMDVVIMSMPHVTMPMYSVRCHTARVFFKKHHNLPKIQ